MAILLAACSVWPGVGHAEVRRCQRPDGGMVYTDRRCEDVGAILAPATLKSTRRSSAHIGCARTIAELINRVSNAINQQDTNQLAEVYHWTGMSGRQSGPLLQRLDAVTHRPLVGILRVMPRPPEVFDDGEGNVPEPTPRVVGRRPVALRIEQTTGDGITPSHTVFGLHRHFGCWWIRG